MYNSKKGAENTPDTMIPWVSFTRQGVVDKLYFKYNSDTEKRESNMRTCRVKAPPRITSRCWLDGVPALAHELANTKWPVGRVNGYSVIRYTALDSHQQWWLAVLSIYHILSLIGSRTYTLAIC